MLRVLESYNNDSNVVSYPFYSKKSNDMYRYECICLELRLTAITQDSESEITNWNVIHFYLVTCVIHTAMCWMLMEKLYNV